MNGNANIFAQLTKVDVEKRIVHGRAAQEVVDKADEIFDYMTSKPHFQSWSAEVAKDSGGKSLGNVRAMHGKVAAGKLVNIDFNDGEKSIDVSAKIVDDNEWKKVLEGVYTGFSIGGKYVGDKITEKMDDGKEVHRYTAQPSEISIVDRPCIPTATFFEVQKADGTVEKVEFKKPVEEPAKAADPVEYTVEGSDSDIAALAKAMTENKINVGQIVTVVTAQPALFKMTGDELAKAWPPKKGKKPTEGEAEAEAEEAHAEPDGDECETPEKAQALHDKCVSKGAKCATVKAETADDLQKQADENADLKKTVDTLNGTVASLTERLAKIEAQPAAPKAILRAVSKGQDVGGEDPTPAPAVIKDVRGDEHHAATVIKHLHQIGGKPLTER